MRAFGNYILSGRAQAIGVISFLTILSLLVPPAAFLASGVPVGLVTLRKGGKLAAQVVVGSMLLTLILTLLLNIQPVFSLVILFTVWLPVLVCAAALRQTESHVFMAMAAACIAAVFVIVMYATIGDVEAWWRSLLTEMLDSSFPTASKEQFKQAIEIAPPLMNAVLASSIVLSLIVTVLIARWWQAALFNPGGFGKEFQTFCLPKQLALPSIIAMGLMFLENLAFGSVLRDLLVIVVILYLFQGIASVHRTVNQKAMSRNWLVGMYCLLVFLPQIMIVFI
ncbi:MAG: DUF2232 domain-containing protein, partial [Gammaproteobacteria bacterium]|nr:DUF2232 domain-containing protein [Gammaproteobacteria bacterium]